MSNDFFLKHFERANVAFVFSDPGGAKAVIALFLEYKIIVNSSLLLSDREYPFYEDMGVDVTIIKKGDIQQVLKLFVPDCICTATSYPEKIELEAISFGKASSNIFTFSLVDHWTNISMRFKSNEKYLFPDKVCVIDEKAKTHALNDGVPSELIGVTGNPYYKYLAHWKPFLSDSQNSDSLGLALNNPYILYAPEPLSVFNLQIKYGFDEIDGLRILIEACLEASFFDSNSIVFKCHPNQNLQIIESYLSSLPKEISDKVKIVSDLDINTLIYYAIVTVGFFSNSLIEAVKIGRPVIRLLSQLNDKILDPLNNFGIGTEVYTMRHLTNELILASNKKLSNDCIS